MKILSIWLIIDFCIDVMTAKYDISLYDVIKGLIGVIMLLGCLTAGI